MDGPDVVRLAGRAFQAERSEGDLRAVGRPGHGGDSGDGEYAVQLAAVAAHDVEPTRAREGQQLAVGRPGRCVRLQGARPARYEPRQLTEPAAAARHDEDPVSHAGDERTV